MDGSLEAGPSSSAPPQVNPSRTYFDSTMQRLGSEVAAQNDRRHGHGDGSPTRASTIIAREHMVGGPREIAEERETWQDFLRRAPPQDIIQRTPEDPVRQAYMRERKAQALEEASRRRRATTSASHRAPPTSPQTSRQHSLSMSLQRPRPFATGIRNRQQPSLSIERPLPRLPSFDVASNHSTTSEYVVPQWQADDAVSSCPICGHAFGLFFRRHHCRKCGRVVCANCSPHRITIPRQFIVHPPADTENQQSTPRRDPTEAVDPTTDDDVLDLVGGEEGIRETTDSALGGGQEVRLCNPCVPDPNPLPPPAYPTHDGGIASFPVPNTTGGTITPRIRGLEATRSDVQRSWEGFAIDVGNPDSQSRRHDQSSSRSPYGSAPHASTSYFPQHRSSHPISFGNLTPQYHHPHHRAHASTSYLPPARSSSLQNVPLPPTPPPPPPLIKEEDECPICHCELPPKGPSGEETAREAHVAECIETHFSSSGPPSSARHPPDIAVTAAIRASAATPSQATSGASSSTVHPVGSPSATTPGSGALRARRRTTGMVVYHATEKDCIDGDGTHPQECVICFEEFQVGDEMGRLECLCKFHRGCIRGWWERKGAGSCPVHQDGI